MRTPPAARATRAIASLVALCGAAQLAACEAGGVRSLGWEIDFESDALRDRAAFVEGRILEGGCASRSVRFAAEVGRGATPEMPPRLEAGRFGFEARARAVDCVWFASACVEVDVPRGSDEVVRITLEGIPEMAACAPATCSAGVCGGAIDAGPIDAGIDDAGPPPDAGACADAAECGECMTCIAGACVPADGAACSGGVGSCLGGTCCTGCWSGRVCQTGDVVAACGTGGDECQACSGAAPYCDRGCAGPRPVADLAVVSQAACAVATDGTLWCWGANNSGELGVGTLGAGTESTSPVRVGTDDEWERLGAGDEHVCAIRTGGELWCWGNNMDGQIGTGDLTVRTVPARVGDAGAWMAVVGASGGDHTCAMGDASTLWCMGQADYGQLGIGPSADRTSPTQVAGTWRTVATGHHFTCAIAMAGTLWCWGENNRGQVGIGTTTTTGHPDVPQQVGTDADWTAIGAGDAHACGVRAGELYCWGYNSDAQLGIGSTASQSLPARVGTATTWAQVSGGLAHTCAIQTDGSLWCWGRNDGGQLGLARTTSTDEDAPQRVGEGVDWEQVRMGDAFTCGLRAAGELDCWGANLLGQLGQGDRITRSSPTRVLLPRP